MQTEYIVSMVLHFKFGDYQNQSDFDIRFEVFKYTDILTMITIP